MCSRVMMRNDLAENTEKMALADFTAAVTYSNQIGMMRPAVCVRDTAGTEVDVHADQKVPDHDRVIPDQRDR